MKRIVREVITLVRIERWLVTDASASSPVPAPEEPDWSLLEPERGDNGAPTSESLPGDEDATDHSPGGSQVISQRVVEFRKWEVRGD